MQLIAKNVAEIILADIRSSALLGDAMPTVVPKKSDVASIGKRTAQSRLSAVLSCIFQVLSTVISFSVARNLSEDMIGVAFRFRFVRNIASYLTLRILYI